MNVAPMEKVSASSGLTRVEPLSRIAHWAAGHWMIWSVAPPLPYCRAVTPVWAHCAKLASACPLFGSGAQGSSETMLVLVTTAGLNASRMLGARRAWS